MILKMPRVSKAHQVVVNRTDEEIEIPEELSKWMETKSREIGIRLVIDKPSDRKKPDLSEAERKRRSDAMKAHHERRRAAKAEQESSTTSDE